MLAMPPALRTSLRQLPLVCVWLLAAWPLLLWLVHSSDPELAVAIAEHTANGLWSGLWWCAGSTLVLCLIFPPAPAWLRLAMTRTWRTLAMDQAPLRRALSELRHFETGARHAEIGRLARLREQNSLALHHLARAVELEDGVAGTWHQLGLILFQQQEWHSACNAFLRAETLDPGHAFGDALLYLGRALHELKDPTALTTLRTHQQRHGGGPRSHVWFAEACQRANAGQEALIALRQAAAPPRQRLSAEENWFRARARVRLWGKGSDP